MPQIGHDDGKIGEITLEELRDGKYTFEIPPYQRGYRWRTEHVTALINDLYGVSNSNKYCLQPIVLKKSGNNSKTFEVVDGQQRLTTLMLLLQEDDYPWKIDTKNDKSVINAACRKNTSFVAWKYKCKICKIKQHLDKIFFIWYLLNEKDDGHAVFQRLNSGKIPLTSSELIRAKLLGDNDENSFEIAAEWERVEQRLRDDRFWFMFNSKASESFTRIDRLFEIVTGTEEKVKSDRLAPYYQVEKKDTNWWEEVLNLFWMLEQCYNDVELYHYIGWLRHFSHAQFSTLYELYKKNKVNFKQNLQKIIIGLGNQIKIGNPGESLSAQDIKGLLFDNPRTLPELPIRNCVEASESISDEEKRKLGDYIESSFEYGNSKLKDFFVLFNIESLNAKVREKDKTEKQRNEYERFPFDLYANISWDIEHIASHTDNPMTDPKEQVEWALETYYERKNNKEGCGNLKNWISQKLKDEKYKQIIIVFLKKLKKLQEEFNDPKECDFESLYNTYKGNDCIREDSKNLVWNLALLDSTTNRSYQNSIFPVKRREIIKVDQTCTGNLFIPPCTRNVFTKYYTKCAVSITQWTNQDASDYKDAIVETFAKLIKAGLL